MFDILNMIWDLPWYKVLVIAAADDVILFIKLWWFYLIIIGLIIGWSLINKDK